MPTPVPVPRERPAFALRDLGHLDGRTLDQVTEVLRRCTEADDVEPVDEATWLRLHDPAAPVRHLLAVSTDGTSPADGTSPVDAPSAGTTRALGTTGAAGGAGDPPAGSLIGYAQLAPSGTVPELALAIHPDHRGLGHGRRLLTAAARRSPTGQVHAWAHGDLPAARALAAAAGLTAVRELRQLGHSLEPGLPDPRLP